MTQKPITINYPAQLVGGINKITGKSGIRKELKYMIKNFQCSNGTTYATADNAMVPVDEVIDFLEEHRGKLFWNGAVAETSFWANSEIVTCDELQHQLAANEDGDYAEYISDFFYGNEETGDDSNYVPREPMGTNDELRPF